MHAEDDFDPLALPPPPPLAPVIPIEPKKRPAKVRPVFQDEPLPPEPPEHEPPPKLQPRAFGRSLPHSLEAEEFLLSCCLLDGADVIQKCLDVKIGSDSFYDPKHGIIFACLVDLHRRGVPTEAATVAEELKTARKLDAVGGYAFIVQVSSRIPTTAQANYFIQKVLEQATLREIIRSGTGLVEDCYDFSGDMLGFADACEKRITEVLRRGMETLDLKPMPHAQLAYPIANDPNILLGNDDWLGRGGGLLFVAHGGAGKSSLIYDACCTWALGESFMGIKANGRLRTLMIQAEDSERYIGKLRTSFDVSLNLNEAKQKQRDDNVIIYHVRGVNGAKFFALLRRLVEKHAPDLVVINPVYLFAEGDISTPDACQPFLVGLDAINRDQRFGYILVHHTGKPVKKDGKGQRVELEDWETIYQGFGSSFFANWPRCTMLLEPREGQHGKFWLRLGKAGANAGITRMVDHNGVLHSEPVTKIGLKYSTGKMKIGGVERPIISWEIDADAKDEPKRKSRTKYTSTPEVFDLLPKNEADAIELSEWERKAMHDTGIGKAAFMQVRVQAITEGTAKKTPGGRYYRTTPEKPKEKTPEQ